MSIAVTPKEQYLEKQYAGGPNCRPAAEPGQDILRDQGLYLEEEERGREDRHGIRQNASQGRTCVLDHSISVYHSGRMVWRGVPPMAIRELPVESLVYDLGVLPKE